MPDVKRIANLLEASARGHGYEVPQHAVGAGFSSETVFTKDSLGHLNDLDNSLNELYFAEAGMRAQDDGFSAILINTVMDYGMRPLRAAVDIPVVGAGQAAMQAALGLGERFGILTNWPPSARDGYDRLVRQYGFDSHYVGTICVTKDEDIEETVAPGGFVDKMREVQPSVLDRIERSGLELIEQGAQVIVLGCTCMSPARDELAARLPCPVLDGLVIAQKQAEMLVSLDLTQVAPPGPAMHGELVRAMVNGGVAAPVDVEDACGDECEILQDAVSGGSTTAAAGV